MAMSEASRQRPDYERSDVSAHVLAMLAAGIGLFLFVTPYLLAALYPEAAHQAGVGILPQPPSPRLQTDAAADLAALRQAESARLSGYGWVERAEGLVRIPISRALALTAERGLPGWPKP
jgi:hypothetical protein